MPADGARRLGEGCSKAANFAVLDSRAGGQYYARLASNLASPPKATGLFLRRSHMAVSVRSYLSTHMLFGARHMERLANETEKAGGGMTDYIRHKSYVVGAVILAASFMEAAMNEFLKDCHEDLPTLRTVLDSKTISDLASYWEGSEREPILSKYQGALEHAGAEMFNRGANPYQDADLRVTLRNGLVHYKPQTVRLGPGSTDDELARLLKGKFAVNPMLGGANVGTLDERLGAGCASWAIQSSLALANEAFSRLKWKPNYQSGAFGPVDT